MTVTGDSHRKCIQEYLLPEMENPNMLEMWFQAHTTRVTIEMLKIVFPNRLISRFGDVLWAPRSRDLNPFDFLGKFKGKRLY